MMTEKIYQIFITIKKTAGCCWKKTTTSLVISILEKKLNILELREIGCILCTSYPQRKMK